jgi:hypothetical protein
LRSTALATFKGNRSLPVRLFEINPTGFDSFRANLSITFSESHNFPGRCVWSIGNAGHAIAHLFLRVLFFLIGIFLLWRLSRVGLNDAKELAFLISVIILSSDPFYFAVFFVSASVIRIADSLIHLFFVVAGLFFLPFLGLRGGNPDKRILAPFLLGFAVIGAFTVRSVVGFDGDPERTERMELGIARIVAVGIYLAVAALLLGKTEWTGFAAIRAVAGPIAIAVVELVQFLNPVLTVGSQVFELALGLEHLLFFASLNWPGGLADEDDSEAGPRVLIESV